MLKNPNRRRAAGATKRDNQQNIRYTDDELKFILAAAAASGMSPGMFQAEAALNEAERVLKKRPRFRK